MAMAMVAGMAHGHAMAMVAGMAHGPGQRVAPFWRPENGQGFAGQRVNRNCCGSPFAPRNCAHFPGTKKGPFFEKKKNCAHFPGTKNEPFCLWLQGPWDYQDSPPLNSSQFPIIPGEELCRV